MRRGIKLALASASDEHEKEPCTPQASKIVELERELTEAKEENVDVKRELMQEKEELQDLRQRLTPPRTKRYFL